MKKAIYTIWAAIILSGCIGPAQGIRPVDDFDISRYLGKWYEITRLDHRFERGLTDVFAVYSLRDDGGIKVLNRGYDEKAGEWKSAEGKAYFAGPEDVGSLKVSFFGPFYAGYHVVMLDREKYQWALVAGANLDYLWILSRQKDLGGAVVDKLVAKADSLGYRTEELIFVSHSRDYVPLE